MSMGRGDYNSQINSKIQIILKGEDDFHRNFVDDKEYIINFIYDWHGIELLCDSNLLPVSTDFYPEFTYNNCLQYVMILRPVWKQSLRYFTDHKEKFKDILDESLQWTGCVEEIKRYFDITTKSPTFVIEGCLFLTAIIENSLGNIYFTLTQKNPPHLLRDLLSCSELKDFFGSFPIFILKILMGSPNSVNLRNILWHGFPSPNDIPEYYLSVLIIILISFSDIVKQKNIYIIYRKKVRLTFRDKIFELTCENEFCTRTILNESEYILKTHKIYWKQIFKYYQEEKYGKFIILVLPQIELVLRLIYGECNQIDVSAKLDEYYITIDTIFEEKVINKPNCDNKIFSSYLDNGILKLLYDLFISPNGPRIRDKVSHGEIDFSTIDKSICSVLLCLSLNLLNKSKSTESSLSLYESRFHINNVAFEKIKSLWGILHKIRVIEVPDELKQFIQWNNGRGAHVNSNEIFHSLKYIKIFSRPKNEGEIVGILIKISNHIRLSCENLLKSFEIRINLFLCKQLRSKRRKTLENVLKSLPYIYDSMGMMIEIIEKIFCTVQLNEKELSNENFRNELRFLKQLLKWVENIAKYCSVDNNEWERATKICSCFRDNLDNFQINYL